MSDPENIATPEEILVCLNSAEFPILLRDMVDYTTKAMSDHSKERAKDLVSDFILKLISGKRKWYKKLTFRHSLFGSLRSDVFNYNRKLKGKHFKELEDEDSVSLEEEDHLEKIIISDLKEIALKTLRTYKPPPDHMEELLFQCKMDGMTKSQDVATFLEVDVKEIYKAEMLLGRKIDPIRSLFKSMGYE